MMKSGRYAQAETVLREALDVARAPYPAHHTMTNRLRGKLSACLRHQGRVDDALEELARAAE